MAVLKDVDHELLRYTCCWEDADLLLQGLGQLEDARVLSIGSAGDNTFSILSRDPEMVLCLDLNPTQLALVRLKAAAFQALDHQEFLGFLGWRAGYPLDYWSMVKAKLSHGDQEFWEEHLHLIKMGLIYQGKFEKYLSLFQKKLLPWIHGSKRVKALFEPKSEEEQNEYYREVWNNWRWSLFTRIFFSRQVMGRSGRDPEFLKQVRGNVGEKIKKRINDHLKSEECQSNFFLKFMLLGSFGSVLPHYARAENFELIKRNLGKLRFFEGPLEDLGDGEAFTHANLSNIFEYQTEQEFAQNIESLHKHLQPEGRAAYWNLMVERDFAKTKPELFEPFEPLALKPDLGFFYQSFNLSKKK